MQSLVMVDRIESTVDRVESLVTQNSTVTTARVELRINTITCVAVRFVALLRVAPWLRIIAFFEKLMRLQQSYCARRIYCVSEKIVPPTRFVAFRKKLFRFGKKCCADKICCVSGNKIVNSFCAILFSKRNKSGERNIFFKTQQIRRAQ